MIAEEKGTGISEMIRQPNEPPVLYRNVAKRLSRKITGSFSPGAGMQH